MARAGTAAVRLADSGEAGACRIANGAADTQQVAFNVEGNSGRDARCKDGRLHASPVAAVAGNPPGFNDIQGSIWQLTEDCWHQNYQRAPTDGRAWSEAGGGDCIWRVARGGAWANHLGNVRAAYRAWTAVDMRSSTRGFRVVRTD